MTDYFKMVRFRIEINQKMLSNITYYNSEIPVKIKMYAKVFYNYSDDFINKATIQVLAK